MATMGKSFCHLFFMLVLFLILVSQAFAFDPTFERAKALAIELGDKDGGILRKAKYTLMMEIPPGGKRVYFITYNPRLEGLESVTLGVSEGESVDAVRAGIEQSGTTHYERSFWHRGGKIHTKDLNEREAREEAEKRLFIMTNPWKY